jgi:hypothetical protein
MVEGKKAQRKLAFEKVKREINGVINGDRSVYSFEAATEDALKAILDYLQMIEDADTPPDMP